MKKSYIIWGLVVVILLGACLWANFKPDLGNKEPMKGSNGVIVEGPNGETYLPHSGVVGKVEEVPAGDTKEDGVKEYRLSGAWAWNEQILPAGCYEAGGAVPVATLTFSSPRYEEQEYTIYFLDGEQVALYYLSEDMTNIYNDQIGWYDVTLRIMDFGKDGQVVSEEFYAFLSKNAMPIAEDAYVETVEQYVAMHNYSVSGYWVWNVNLSYDGRVSLPLHGWFASGYDFALYGVEPEGLMTYHGCFPDTNLAMYNFVDCMWMDGRDRYMDLGEAPQSLEPASYAWFVANARPCTKETYEAMCTANENERPGCLPLPDKNMTWENAPLLIKEDLDYVDGRDWEIHGDFFSNGQYFEMIRGEWNAETNVQTVYYVVHTKRVAVCTDGEWTNEAYRDFTAVNEPLWCTPESLVIGDRYGRVRQGTA